MKYCTKHPSLLFFPYFLLKVREDLNTPSPVTGVSALRRHNHMQLFKQFEDTDSNYLYLLGIVVEGKPRKYLRAARRKFQTVMSPKIEAEGDGEPVRKKSVHID